MLFASACVIGGVHISAADVEEVWDLWPLGPGTKEAIKRIFPGARTRHSHLEAVQTLQKSFGGGRRGVTMVSLSVILCIRLRVDSGTVAGSYFKRRRLA